MPFVPVPHFDCLHDPALLSAAFITDNVVLFPVHDMVALSAVVRDGSFWISLFVRCLLLLVCLFPVSFSHSFWCSMPLCPFSMDQDQRAHMLSHTWSSVLKQLPDSSQCDCLVKFGGRSHLCDISWRHIMPTPSDTMKITTSNLTHKHTLIHKKTSYSNL